MDRAMADKMIGIIQADATHRGGMFHFGGGMCALGGLYAAAVNKTGLQLFREYRKKDASPLYADMESIYNIHHSAVQAIYETNDAFNDLTERRAALTELINSWVKE